MRTPLLPRLALALALTSACTTVAPDRDPLDAGEWRTTKSRLYQDLALQCLQAEDHDRARSLLQQAVQFDGRDPRTIELLARLAYSQGDLATAADAARRLLAADPKSVAGLCMQGAVLESENRAADAETCYRQAAAAAPADPRPLVDLHRLLLDLGRDDEAAEVRADAERRFPATIGPEVDHGALLASRGQWVAAAAAFDRALARDPADPAATAGFALASVMSRESGRAIELGDRLAPHVRAGNPSLQLTLATAHLQAGDCVAALQELELASADVRDRAPSHLLRGEILYRMQHLEAALAAFERAIDLDPKLARAHASLGRVHLLQRRPHAAVRALEQAVALEPANGSSQALLAAAYAAVGDRPAAARHRAVALRLPGTAALVAQVDRVCPGLSTEEGAR